MIALASLINQGLVPRTRANAGRGFFTGLFDHFAGPRPRPTRVCQQPSVTGSRQGNAEALLRVGPPPLHGETAFRKFGGHTARPEFRRDLGPEILPLLETHFEPGTRNADSHVPRGPQAHLDPFGFGVPVRLVFESGGVEVRAE